MASNTPAAHLWDSTGPRDRRSPWPRSEASRFAKVHDGGPEHGRGSVRRHRRNGVDLGVGTEKCSERGKALAHPIGMSLWDVPRLD